VTAAGQAPVLVTGATGFVGGAVVRHLLERGSPVRALVRDEARTARLAWMRPPVAVYVGDTCDPGSLRQAMDGCCLVLNCAGLNSFWEPDKRAYERINVEGTRTVMTAALEAGVPKIVHVSTVMAYGFPERMPFSADSPVGPHMSWYARSKHAGDEAAWELHRSHGLPLVVVSLAAVVGRGDPKAVMQIKSFVEGRVPVMIGPQNLFTYVDIDDAAEAIVRAGFAPGNVGSRYLVGAHRLTTEQYFGIISGVSGVPMPRLRMGRTAAMALARLLTAWAGITGRPPLMPLDLMRTVFRGSLLFDGEAAAVQLGLHYTPIRRTLAEAVADARGG
jgi:dihydroflavonol-4-reductase